MKWLKQLIGQFGFLGMVMFAVVLPPRPGAPVVSEPTVKVAAIELAVSTQSLGADSAELYAQVQWLAGDGTWVNTDGWRGTLDTDGMQHWAVGKSLYGQTAFRWQVLDMEGGEVIGTSETFDLPTRDGEIVVVEVSAE